MQRTREGGRRVDHKKGRGRGPVGAVGVLVV
jgi:hypothetical protein